MDTNASGRRAAGPVFALLACAALAAVSVAALAGCATSAPAAAPPSGESDDAATYAAAGSGATAADCSGATTDGYDLFLDPALSVEPAGDVLPLQAEGDTISFTYAGDLSGSPTFSWDISYIQPDGGEVSPVGGAPFFDESGGTFSVSGPQSPVGAEGGPYPGFLDVIMVSNARFDDETQSYTADQTVIGRVCVLLAE